MPGRVDGGLGPSSHPELRQHRSHIVLDRLLRQIQPLGDLPVGQSFGEQLEDLTFLWAEPGDPFVLARPAADPFEDPGGDGRVEQALPGGDPQDRVDQIR